ncbi:hypothetical protein BH10PLA2_BH10PLA2_08650 [soil metagenome]
MLSRRLNGWTRRSGIGESDNYRRRVAEPPGDTILSGEGRGYKQLLMRKLRKTRGSTLAGPMIGIRMAHQPSNHTVNRKERDVSMAESPAEIQWSDFERVDLRIGTVTAVENFPEARRPAYKLWIDFGPDIGIRKSSAQLTIHYTREQLLGRQVLAVLNFPRKQVGPFMSEVLVTGFADANGAIILAQPERPVPNGARLV